MIPGSLDVFLEGRRVGSLSNLTGDYNVFTFDEDYLADPRRPVLSQAYIDNGGEPLQHIPRTHRVAPAFFANLLPEDGSVLRTLVAQQYGINRTRDFPYLHVLGQDLPGALIMRSAEGIANEPHESVVALEPDERPISFSLAGVQIKFSAHTLDQRLTVGAEGDGAAWIVKLPTNAFPRLPENEYHVMGLATAVGLNVPEIRLVPLDAIAGIPHALPMLRKDEPRLAYAIKRFDRTERGRVHAEDFNQVADQKPDEKYGGKASHWIARVVSELCPAADVDDVVRRLVFGVCVGNNDMHLKNWGLVYPDGRNPRLAPVYDYVCTRYYYPAAGLALTIGDDREFERIDRDALRRFARRAEISARRTVVLANEVVEAVRESWRDMVPNIDDRGFAEAMEQHFETVPLMARQHPS